MHAPSPRPEDEFSRAGERARVRQLERTLGLDGSDAEPRRPSGRRRGVVRRHLGTVCAVVGVFLLVLTAPAVAQPTASSDPAAKERADRDAATKKSGEIEAQLDVLEVSDEQLNGELLQLDDRLKQQEAKARDAEAGRAAVDAQVHELDRQVRDAEAAAREARRFAADRAVNAYMRPDRETATQMLAAKDPQALGKMHVLVTNVAEFDHSIMLHRASAEQLLKGKQTELTGVRQQAAALAEEAEADVREVADLRLRRAAVHEELQVRITDLKNESAALDRQEAQLTQLISQREAQATTTTTAAPTTTTTTAPTTTVAPVPGAPSTAPTTAKATTTAAPTTAKPPSAGTSLGWPVSGPVTSPFGARWGTFHKGIDVGVGMGTPIAAAAAGTVFFSGQMSGYGNVILIDHGNGMVTLYAHQSSLIAGNGAQVARGQTIGLVGSTGHSTGPHLHFEVRINGVAYDPMAYLG